MINFKKKYFKYKSKNKKLNTILGGGKENKSNPLTKFQKLNDYFVSIRNKKLIENTKKLQEKYQIK